jgi:hypothetical protein
MSINDEGAAKIIANLNHQLTQTKGLTLSGLLAGGLIIQRNSQKRVPSSMASCGRARTLDATRNSL